MTLALLAAPASAGKKEEEAASLIERAKQLSDIRAEGASAFRLKMRFETVEGTTAQNGVYSEIWISKTQWRSQTVLGDFRRTVVASGRKRWTLNSADEVNDRITDVLGFFRVGTLQPELWKPDKIEDKQLGGRGVRCIETSPGPRGGRSALCFNQSDGSLVAEIQPLRIAGKIADKDCVFSDYQKFGDRLVARSYRCYEDGQLKLQAKIDEIAPEPTPDAALFAPLDGAKESANCLGPVKPGALVEHVTPRSAAATVRNALVVIEAAIGTDGRLYKLKVTSPPNPDFDQPALEAVRQWRYKPFTRDGVPVEVETEVEVNFSQH